MTDAEHEDEKRALREQLGAATVIAENFRDAMVEAQDRLATVTRERDEARKAALIEAHSALMTRAEELWRNAKAGEESGEDDAAAENETRAMQAEEDAALVAKLAEKTPSFTAARDCQNTTAGCHTPMACESAGRCEWPVPGKP